MPRAKGYDETEVLDRATRAFWARGYEATSMRDLVEATGLHRGSLYAAFDDKRGLFLESLRHFDKTYRADFFDAIAREHVGKDAIVAAFQGVCQMAAEGDVPGGCLLVNTALELSPHDSEVRDFIDARLRDVEDFFFAQLEVAKRDGAMSGAPPSRQTAQALLGLFLGLRVLTRTGPNEAAAKAIVTQVETILE
jgi:TetR/AcrR family transcriptional repressor of nem operon